MSVTCYQYQWLQMRVQSFQQFNSCVGSRSITLQLLHAVSLGRASPVATSVAFEFNSRGVTDDSETHYRGITALFT